MVRNGCGGDGKERIVVVVYRVQQRAPSIDNGLSLAHTHISGGSLDATPVGGICLENVDMLTVLASSGRA